MTNNELFQLYDNDLVLRLRNAKNLSDTRKILNGFKQYLDGFPPSPELFHRWEDHPKAVMAVKAAASKVAGLQPGEIQTAKSLTSS